MYQMSQIHGVLLECRKQWKKSRKSKEKNQNRYFKIQKRVFYMVLRAWKKPKVGIQYCQKKLESSRNPRWKKETAVAQCRYDFFEQNGKISYRLAKVGIVGKRDYKTVKNICKSIRIAGWVGCRFYGLKIVFCDFQV